MVKAMWVSALVGCVCAFLSAYLMLKGWSLIGDALSHSIVPGVAGAYMLGLPFAVGAFFPAGLPRSRCSSQAEDAVARRCVIGLIFSALFGLGLFMVSLSPTPVNIQTIVLGNILAISPEDTLQLAIIGACRCSSMLAFIWKDLMVTFFDESHARSIGINPTVC
jgi:manganese/iron transport system permease protein